MTQKRMEGLPLPFDMAFIEITPQLARQWLGENATEFQRRASEKKVNDYADAMARDCWTVTGDSIKFDNKDRLIDGQHRLRAVIQSGCSIRTIVIRGCQPVVMASLDRGKARSYKDWLDIHKVPNASTLAAITQTQYDIDHEQFALGRGKSDHVKHTPTNDELDKVRERHPGLAYAAKTFDDRPKLKSLLGAPSALWFYHFARRDLLGAKEFIDNVELGGIADPDDPVQKLRDLLHENRGARNNRISRRGIQARMIKAWNARVTNQKPRALSFRDYGKNPEPWPEVLPQSAQSDDPSFMEAVQAFFAQAASESKTA